MPTSRLIALLCLLTAPISGHAWDEQLVLEYIMDHNPVLSAYRSSMGYYKPAKGTDRILDYTSLYSRLGVGGTDMSTGGVVAQAGVQLKIPLSSKKERREWAQKNIEQVQTFDDIRNKVYDDIGTLRQYEADLSASAIRLEFLQDKSTWAQERLDSGMSEQAPLWEIGAKLTEEKATVERLSKLRDAQQYRVAWHAGPDYKKLLEYLRGKGTL